jgi:4-hydroxy-3-methylbut-2-enyl diphosphate reductase
MEIVRARLDEFEDIPDGDLCIGVDRPKYYYDKALEKANGTVTIYALRPEEELIPYPDKKYEARGVSITKELPDPKDGPVVVASRGAPPSVKRTLKEKAYDFQDATCPYVLVQEKKSLALLDEGYNLIICSNAHHHGIERLSKIAEERGQKVFCVEFPEEVDEIQLKPTARVAVIGQTTQWIENFKAVVAKLIERFKEVKVVNTICVDSLVRFPETERLARSVDLMLVIGRTEGMTFRMEEICKKVGTPVKRFDSLDVISREWFEGVGRVGIIGGNATHKSVVDAVEARVRAIST